jgi:hypothetical protein
MNPFRIAISAIALAVVACSVEAKGPQPPPATSVPLEATATPVAVATAAPASTPTSAPFVPFTVTTWADNVVLRADPGHLSKELGILPDNTAVTVLGRTPGGEWLMVKTADSRLGWVFDQLVESTGPETSSAPLVNPTGVIVLRGRLTDIGGGAVTGIQFAVVQAGVSEEVRTDAMTDADGVFYAFLPPDAQGSWWVSYTAISCESNMMDATCSNWSGEPDPKGMYVQLPGGAHSALQFTWK